MVEGAREVTLDLDKEVYLNPLFHTSHLIHVDAFRTVISLKKIVK